MNRLYTQEQVFRAFRKEMRKYQIQSIDQLKEVLFNYMDERFIHDTYLDILTDLYGEGYLTEDTFDEAIDALYLYYGDLVSEFIQEVEDDF